MKPITRVSITDQVVETLKESIMNGTYSKGDKLPPEHELSKQLQVGRSTVREALRVLQAINYVEIIHGRGAFVAEPNDITEKTVKNWFTVNSYKISDIMDARLTVEQMSVRLCVKNMTQKELEELCEIQQNFIDAIRMDESSNKLALYDEYFHRCIAQGSHNPLFVTINQQISDSMCSYRMHSFSIRANCINAVQPHQNIINAIEMRDVQKAEAAMASHIRVSLQDMANAIKGNSLM